MPQRGQYLRAPTIIRSTPTLASLLWPRSLTFDVIAPQNDSNTARVQYRTYSSAAAAVGALELPAAAKIWSTFAVEWAAAFSILRR